MKKQILVLVLSLCLAMAFIGEASARGGFRGGGFRMGGSGVRGFSCRPVPVRPYIRKNGTVVMPHFRTSPNATIKDNWSTRPNINPFTGKPGTRNPFSAP
jgi:hypothetical protein